MPLRLLVAAFAAALLATLGLMFARVATMSAALLDTGAGDLLLLRHLGLGLFGGLTLQVFLLYRPNAGVNRGLVWGVAGFLVFALMPWLVLPDTVPGEVSHDYPFRWLIVTGCTAGGLWLLWSPGNREKTLRNRRLAGVGLLILPLLAGLLGGDGHGPPDAGALDTGGAGLDGGPDDGLGADFGVWRGLALNLLFWLLLGLFSILTARRIVQRPQGADDGENDASGTPGSGS